MAQKPTCLVCHKEMERGFVTDMAHGNVVKLPRWCPGEPNPSFWGGDAKNAQREAGFSIVAFRCPECEALRLYAPSSQS